MATRYTQATVGLFAAPAIWAADFLAIYIFTALACARRFDASTWLGIGVVPWVIGLATLIALTFTLTLTLRSLRGARRHQADDTALFVHRLSAAIGGLCSLAILWNAWPVLFVPICG
ncbi:MAG TPA: hypothetical protein VI457_08040 [Methylococcaceae bacterium]|nr:hypothetical protein [Methylococcaceae bacterium]